MTKYVSIITFMVASAVMLLSYQNCENGQFCAARRASTSLSSEGGDGGGVTTKPVEEVLNIMVGDFKPLAEAIQLQMNVSGKAMIVRSNLGYTKVYTQIAGFDATTTYMAHVHNLPCGVSSGGGHYKIDTAIADALETNELWPSVTTDIDGRGTGYAESLDHVARSEAQSVVVHIPGTGNRLACADLYSQETKQFTAGAFTTTAAGTGLGFVISGNGILERSVNGTRVKAVVSGLTPDAMFMAHVHVLPCNDPTVAGGHYLINEAVGGTPAIESNEIWLRFMADANGVGQAETSVNHIARANAQSIVVHGMVDANGVAPKIACLDLTAGGGMLSTVAGLTDNMQITGSGKIYRHDDGQTQVDVSFAGLMPNTTYMSHVHNLPCKVGGGGGHYKLDPSIADVVPNNEIWPQVVSNAAGTATSSLMVDHLARPEAQSVVIHHPDGSGARIACIDL